MRHTLKGATRKSPPTPSYASLYIGTKGQTNYLLDKQIRGLDTAFVKERGLREHMTRARLQQRNIPRE